MKKIFLFMIMVVLVVMTARSIFCFSDQYDPFVEWSKYATVFYDNESSVLLNYEGEKGLLTEINACGSMVVDSKRMFCPLEINLQDQVVTGKAGSECHCRPHEHNGVRKNNQEDLSVVISDFQKSKDFSEYSLQQLVNLLDKEIDLVANVYNGRTGYIIENKMADLMKFKRLTPPSVLYVYNKIMIQATSGPDYIHREMGIKIKKKFLSTMKGVLEQNFARLRQLQHQHFMATMHHREHHHRAEGKTHLK